MQDFDYQPQWQIADLTAIRDEPVIISRDRAGCIEKITYAFDGHGQLVPAHTLSTVALDRSYADD